MALTAEQTAVLRTVGVALSLYFNFKFIFSKDLKNPLYKQIFLVVFVVSIILGLRASKQ